jgi:serine/threonine protein kinase
MPNTRAEGPTERIPSPPDIAIYYDQLTIGDRIGTGGYADVYRAQVSTAEGPIDVAVKQPRFEGTIGQQIVDQFLAEAETWSKLDDDDYIVGVIDYGSEPIPWIAMEYMDGGDLGALIQGGGMSLAQRAWTAGRVLEGVHYAHRHGVVHLDLKPANVLLRTTGEDTWPVPKVGDWGLAKLLLEHSGSIEGLSPGYAAPEQFDAAEYGEPDDLTDLYQLGVICYELFTGKPPFDGRPPKVMQDVLERAPEPPSSVDPSLPTAIDEPILTALAKRKGDRQDSVLLFREDLRAALDGDWEGTSREDANQSRRQLLKYGAIAAVSGVSGAALIGEFTGETDREGEPQRSLMTPQDPRTTSAPRTATAVNERVLGANVVEDFESGLDAWEKVKGNAEDKITISENRAYSGSRSMRVRNLPSGSGPTVAARPGSGLGTYPTRNSVLTAVVTYDNNDGRHSMHVVDTDGNRTLVGWDAYKNFLRIVTDQDSKVADIDVETFVDRWVELELDLNHRDGNYTARARDDDGELIGAASIGSADLKDDELTIGFGSQGYRDTDASLYVDDVGVVSQGER